MFSFSTISVVFLILGLSFCMIGAYYRSITPQNLVQPTTDAKFIVNDSLFKTLSSLSAICFCAATLFGVASLMNGMKNKRKSGEE
jgi:hypothetical protein